MKFGSERDTERFCRTTGQHTYYTKVMAEYPGGFSRCFPKMYSKICLK
jgi:hypothetical protein